MKVVVLSDNVFEARDMARRMGMSVQDTLIIRDVLVARRWKPSDGDLILEMASWENHPDREAVERELLQQIKGHDVRWEKEKT